MTEYQAISARRACLQAATLLCAYAAARYQKLTLPKSSVLTFMAAGILQGVSTKVRMPLGERSRWNWLLDGVSLGLVVYGTSKLELARRVKSLVAGAMGGTQVLISNARPNIFFERVAAIDVNRAGAEEKVNALCDELEKQEGQLPIQDLIRACTILLPKTLPFFDGDFGNSATGKLQILHIEAVKCLSGWEKATAQMHFYELANKHRIYFPKIEVSEKCLNAAERVKRQGWLDTTGFWITQRWAIWRLKNRDLERGWNTLQTFTPNDRLTVEQKADLWDEYITVARELEGGMRKGSWCHKACTFKETSIKNLDGFEKCQAYMKLAEFYFRIGIIRNHLFGGIFDEIHQALNLSEKLQFEKWMEETGNAIQTKWTEKQ